jgi:hypothetical protein
MTGRVIDRETAGFLILLIPLAIAAVVLLNTWPYILGLIGLIIAWRLWQNYQWLKWCEQVNPLFNELIKENQGCLTPMDLSLKANLAGGAAKRFLEKKAEEYGAQKKTLKDKGTLYYFLTASALGSIFDDSEPLGEWEEETPFPKHEESPRSGSIPQKFPPENSIYNISQLVNLEDEPEISPEVESQEETIGIEIEKDSNLEVASEPRGLELIQADLAKRLETTPSTIGRRKSDPDFAEWSQSKDPQGLAWKYVAERKTFVPWDDQEL